MKKIDFIYAHNKNIIRVQPGETYVFKNDTSSRDGNVHPRGSKLLVHDATDYAPFGEVGPYGNNWYCSTQFGVSVWATLEQCIERGILRKVE